MKERARLYTFGYEGRSTEKLTKLAKEFEIKTIVDVRFLARSRKKGFSGGELLRSLASFGIDYLHIPQLGVPREYRERLLGLSGSEGFYEAYLEILGDKSPAILDIAQAAQKGNVLLLCYEREPSRCHRSAVARLLEERFPLSFNFFHIR